MIQQASLFGLSPVPELSLADFDVWANSRTGQNSLGTSSKQVYLSMWRAFVAWSISKRLMWGDHAAHHLQEFINDRKISSPQQRRYLWLIAEISRAHNRTIGESIESACQELIKGSSALKFALARHHRKPPQILGKESLRALFREIAIHTRDVQWQRRRDSAMMAVILGAGLKPSEALHLTIDKVEYDGASPLPYKLVIDGNGNNAAHETPISDWASLALSDWLQFRATLSIDSRLAFPAALDGGVVDKNTLIRQFDALATASGIKLHRGGTHVLRHTWAVRQMLAGTEAADVRQWLGLEANTSMAPYTKIVTERQGVR